MDNQNKENELVQEKVLAKEQEETKKEETKIEIKDISASIQNFNEERFLFEGCLNTLLGNFDADKNYVIRDIIKSELTNYKKIIFEEKEDKITATASLNNHTLHFSILLDKKKSSETYKATLQLEEKLLVGNIINKMLTTTLAVFSQQPNPNFLENVKEKFHLLEKDEFENLKKYTGTPLETFTEIFRKQELLKQKMFKKNELDKKYLTEMFAILGEAILGKKILQKYLSCVKEKEFDKITENKYIYLKKILDDILNLEINNHSLEKNTFDKILQAREQYMINSKNLEAEYSKTQGAIQTGVGEAKVVKEKAKASGGKSSSGGGKSDGGKKSGGGGGKSGGGDSGEKSGGKKDDKKSSGLILPVTPQPTSKIANKTAIHQKAPDKKEETLPDFENLRNALIKAHEKAKAQIFHDCLQETKETLKQSVQPSNEEETLPDFENLRNALIKAHEKAKAQIFHDCLQETKETLKQSVQPSNEIEK